ncbi:MAG: DUF2752 domain-containing protein [Limisphaerales bacterium]
MLARNKLLILLLGAAAAIIPAAVLYWFPPNQYVFYPRCLFNVWTGLDCAGCGALRAMHQLLHGNVVTAFLLNPLLILVLPFLVAHFVNYAVTKTRGRPLFEYRLPGYLIWIFLAVLLVFTILRNLPFAPFSWMAASS